MAAWKNNGPGQNSCIRKNVTHNQNAFLKSGNICPAFPLLSARVGLPTEQSVHLNQFVRKNIIAGSLPFNDV